MKLKISKKLYSLLLAGCMITISCTGKKEKEIIPVTHISIEEDIDDTKTSIEHSKIETVELIENTINETVELIENTINEPNDKKIDKFKEVDHPIYNEDDVEYNSRIIPTVKANENVWVRALKGVESEKLGKLVEGRELELIANDDPNWYTVNYYGATGYVSKEYASRSSKRVMNIPIIKKGYLTNKDIMYTNKSMRIEKMELEKLEFVEIYKEYDDCYMVATIDGLGFVPKDNVEIVKGNMFVVDESDQEGRVYEETEDPLIGNEVMTLITPVVTGTKNTDRESEKGFFTVWTKWKGPGYMRGRYYADNATFYNHDDGFHDATSWMPSEKFGGDTYLTNGSHGCTNMKLEESRYANKVIQVGDKVLIKR